MIRTAFYQPEGELTPSVVLDVLELVCTDAPRIGEIVKWTTIERLVAYDWAIREHLVAGDNIHVRRRPRPSFTVGPAPVPVSGLICTGCGEPSPGALPGMEGKVFCSRAGAWVPVAPAPAAAAEIDPPEVR